MAGCADAKAFVPLWDILRDKFSQTKDGYINPEMEEHREQQKKVCDQNSTKAKKRWGKDAVALPQHMPTDMPNACNPESESNPNPESNQESDSEPTSTSNPNPDSPVEEDDERELDSNTQTSELATKLWEALGSPKHHNPSRWAGILSKISPDWSSGIPNLIHYVSICPKWKKYLSEARHPAAYFVSQLVSIEGDRVHYEANRDATRKDPVTIPPKPAVTPLTEEQALAAIDSIRKGGGYTDEKHYVEETVPPSGNLEIVEGLE
jgi:hypothetical protein